MDKGKITKAEVTLYVVFGLLAAVSFILMCVAVDQANQTISVVQDAAHNISITDVISSAELYFNANQAAITTAGIGTQLWQQVLDLVNLHASSPLRDQYALVSERTGSVVVMFPGRFVSVSGTPVLLVGQSAPVLLSSCAGQLVAGQCAQTAIICVIPTSAAC